MTCEPLLVCKAVDHINGALAKDGSVDQAVVEKGFDHVHIRVPGDIERARKLLAMAGKAVCWKCMSNIYFTGGTTKGCHGGMNISSSKFEIGNEQTGVSTGLSPTDWNFTVKEQVVLP